MNDHTLFQSPQDGDLDTFDYSPDLEFEGDNGFDFENADLGGDMIGALPGVRDHDHAEKRKSREESVSIDDGDHKRQELDDGNEKAAKKPGRKPLTTEPTTKRKAQNRAAQRAFRERKEKHVKDLETKVGMLEKASEADKHENGMLKAQVDRLQVELREYRKRLSLNSTRTNGSPPLVPYGSQQRSNSGSSIANGNGGFQFEFPKFGGLPGSQLLGNGTYNNSTDLGTVQRNSHTPPVKSRSQSGSVPIGAASRSESAGSRKNSHGSSLSPVVNSFTQAPTTSPQRTTNVDPAFTSYSTTNNMHGFASTLPQMNGVSNDDTFGGLFSPSILKNAGSNAPANGYFNSQTQSINTMPALDSSNDFGGNSTAGINRAFQFNSGSSGSDSASPSSSLSQWNANNGNSSCDTSPEPSHGSPGIKDKPIETSFAQSGAASNLNNSNQPSLLSNIGNINFLSNADFSVPSLDNFDPVLFGDYRDSNEAIVGGGDFTGGFFNDAVDTSAFDYPTPSNLFGILQSPQQQQTSIDTNATNALVSGTQTPPSKKCLQACDKIRDGGDDDYGLPKPDTNLQQKQDSTGKFISCNNVWAQIQANADYQDGKFDMESLCSELRSKARCSESGVMVDQDHVDQALRKLVKKDEQGNTAPAPQYLEFEQESWDKVFQKMSGQ